METELKNIIERFIQQIKDRTECFDDHFPCRIIKCDRQTTYQELAEDVYFIFRDDRHAILWKAKLLLTERFQS
jgi:hypothetical protein